VVAWDIVTLNARPEAVNAFLAEHAPPVLDPFCGGGSIPLEAQRLGLRAYASDLNPVAVLITKALIEIPPKFANLPPVNPEYQRKSSHEKAAHVWRGAAGLAEDVRYYGQWMRDEAAKRIGHLYPKVKVTREMAKDRPDLMPYVGEELTVIAWLWARTVASPTPAVGGAHVPLVRSFWLSTKKGKEAWVRPVVTKGSGHWHFEVGVGKPPADFDPGIGTIGRKGGRCILSGVPMGFPHVRSEGQAGRMKQRLMAIVAEGRRGRVYLSPVEEHVTIAESAVPAWKPDARLPDNPRDFKTPNYGMMTFADLFTNRQLTALVTFSDLVGEARAKVLADARAAYSAGACGASSGGPHACDAAFQPADTSGSCGAGFQPASWPVQTQPSGAPGQDSGNSGGTRTAESTRAAGTAAPQGYEFLDPRTTPFVPPASRGELPHLYKEGGTYFATFRLFDAVTPDEGQAGRPDRNMDPAQAGRPHHNVGPGQPGRLHHKRVHHKRLHHKVDPLEQAARYDPPIGLGSGALRDPVVAAIVRDALLHFAGERYHLLRWCIMPNHVHVIFAPIAGHTPSDILHSWKSFTSKQANKALGRTGTFWERESFDHLIRSADDLERFVLYVDNNPVTAGLCRQPEDWPWNSCSAGLEPAGTSGPCDAGFQPAQPSPSVSQPANTSAPCGVVSQPAGTSGPCGAGFQPADTSASQAAGQPEQEQQQRQQPGRLHHNDDRPLDQGGTGPQAYADAVATYLGLGIDKIVDYNSRLVTWITQRDQAGHALTKQALPMVWDFAEVNPLVGAAGDLTVSLQGIARVTEAVPARPLATTYQLDTPAALCKVETPLVCTDPPYYDNIGYADLSDFFYIWLRRSLGRVYPQLFATLLTPKAQELIASPYRHEGDKDKAQSFFEEGLGKAFAWIREAEHPDHPLTVYYAFKQAEDDAGDDDDDGTAPGVASTGWETMLEGLIRSGFAVTGTWPMRTERGARSIGIGTNALASSIVLVCRPRGAEASLATRREFLLALKRELPEALRNLQRGNIAPVDLAQAAIGPGMAVFTRYAKVMETDGSPMTVRTALALINQALDEVLAEQEGEFEADTRWALAWFEQYGMNEGPFGVAETLSKAKNTAVNGLVEAGIVEARAGKVRLLRRNELVMQASSLPTRSHQPSSELVVRASSLQGRSRRASSLRADSGKAGGTPGSRKAGGTPAPQWDPATDRRLTIWEVTQHLIHALVQQGETGAATLLRKVGGMGETARDLAYRLYTICERKKWADEAREYNGLVIAWPELTRLAIRPAETPKPAEKELF